jgi:polyketide biosynthesis enoyl-CoA hydratase PksH
MLYKTLLVKETSDSMTLTLNRMDHQNSINIALLNEINFALDAAEEKLSCRVVILEGQEGLFCTGMDFKEMYPLLEDPEKIRAWTTLYMSTLKRFTITSKIIISKVNGKVIAGGMGLVAASDFVIATPNSTFKLTEALWGLMPAMVAPFLIRRVGTHQAYKMALTCQTMTATQASELHLIDELNDQPDETINQLLQRFIRLDNHIVQELKVYFKKMWIITESMEKTAIDTTTHFLMIPEVKKKIQNFVEHHQLPWEKNQ